MHASEVIRYFKLHHIPNLCFESSEYSYLIFFKSWISTCYNRENKRDRAHTHTFILWSIVFIRRTTTHARPCDWIMTQNFEPREESAIVTVAVTDFGVNIWHTPRQSKIKPSGKNRFFEIFDQTIENNEIRLILL